jgi:hypothetical protein
MYSVQFVKYERYIYKEVPNQINRPGTRATKEKKFAVRNYNI